jgi:hypothetical protein
MLWKLGDILDRRGRGIFQPAVKLVVGRDSSVGIAIRYGLDGPGIETRRGRDFPHLSTPALGPPSLLYNWYRGFLGGKERPGRSVDHPFP